MTDKTEPLDFENMFKDTSCYTYEVTMLVQVLAPTKEVADAKLDQDGGYVSKRDVKFMRSVVLHVEGDPLKIAPEKNVDE
jgi:hypothetical protein